MNTAHATTAVSKSRLVENFPFPFTADRYRYTTNVEPAASTVATAAGHWGGAVVDIDGEYRAELDERAAILAADPARHVVLPHMRPAAWDAMLTLMRALAQAYPDQMQLRSTGPDTWSWRNAILGIEQSFRYGDEASLGMEPLRYIASQVQEDIVLLDQRGDALYIDAGVVTFAADWSFGFDVGMSFLEIHGPVPRIRKEGIIIRAHEFLKRLQPHQPYRRTNWTMTIGRRLDVSTELYPEWGPDRETIRTVDDAEFGRAVHLRVEVQHLIRLADSGALMFLIRTYLLPLDELATVEAWRVRTAEVLAELPDDMAEYKGIGKYRNRAAQWLRDHGPHAAADNDRNADVPADQHGGLPSWGLPHWPPYPPEVDTAGAAYLVVAIGADVTTGRVARDWVAAASSAGPTRLLVLDTLTHDMDRTALTGALDESITGTRILIVGGQGEVMWALSVARAKGAIAAELTAYVVHTRDLLAYCAHCAQTTLCQAAPGDIVDCPGCGRRIEIHAHHSSVRGSFLACAAAGEESA
ncbi:MAG: DUF3445 domain-containing protein [Gordonia sp. (in: high G+C Gram-positive bacteria)]